MAMEKMGITESSDRVHTAVAMAAEKIEFFLVLSIAIATAVWMNLYFQDTICDKKEPADKIKSIIDV